MNQALGTAELLLGQRRYREAEEMLRLELTAHPQNAYAHSLLAVVLIAQQQETPALEEARNGVGLDPNGAYVHRILGWVLFRIGRIDEAMRSFQESIRLDPTDPRPYGILGECYAKKGDWTAAFEAVNEGLRYDPEHLECLHLKARLLARMGRGREAEAVLNMALKINPEYAGLHESKGHVLLHRQDAVGALNSFREALRLDPDSKEARSGTIESLRLGSPIYRWLRPLDDLVTPDRISLIVIAAVTLGVGFAVYPPLRPVTGALLVLLALLLLFRWVAPLTDLSLRITDFGRRVMTEDQILASNLAGACLLLSLSLAAGGLLLHNTWMLVGSPLSLLLLLPIMAKIGPNAKQFRARSARTAKIVADRAVIAGALVFLSALCFLGISMGAPIYFMFFFFLPFLLKLRQQQ